MKIVCAGFHRSGSTWLYNVVRIMCEEVYGKQNVCARFFNQWDQSQKASCYVIKTHRFQPSLIDADFIFTTIRDLRDVAASAVRMKMIEESQAYTWTVNLLKQEYEPWKKYTQLELVYEHFIEKKVVSIARIAKRLKFDLDAQIIHEKVESIKIPTDKADVVEQLHPNHISNENHRGLLSKSTIRKIEKSDITGEFMKNHLYV